ncbi:MAG: sirohydrochlorin cobaltochelatase [Treponema sp.]|jgi:sirohydrochlorin cobaltochelatase|nr:sirohydrochlorin cobaltochelatase [Treponema sp.]
MNEVLRALWRILPPINAETISGGRIMNNLQKTGGALAVLLLVLSFLNCRSVATPQAEPEKPVILVVSFGTSYNESRQKTIGAIEDAIARAYPAYSVRRAFTSQIVIDHIYQRDGEKIDNVTEALNRLVAEGAQDLIVQPTHLMQGIEQKEMLSQVQPFESKFRSIKYGKPVLASEADYTALVSILREETNTYAGPDTAIVFMGHGTEAASNADYTKLAALFKEQGLSNYFIGTVEASPSLDDVIVQLREAGLEKLTLLPLMIVAGDHANNDMAGDEEDSWKSILTAEGFSVQTVLRGLGEYPELQAHIVQHVADAMR